MTKLGYTLHEIHRGKDEKLPVKTVQSFEKEQFNELIKLGAIRFPTDDEIALYRMANPEPAAAPITSADEDVPAPKSKAGRKPKATAATEAPKDNAETATDADPEVEDAPLV